MFSPATKSNPAPTRAPIPVIARSRFPRWFPAALLALVIVVVYWPATRCDFVNYDDEDYVTENLQVQSGLNWAGVKWTFVNPVVANWHPLTMLSHMLDCQLFGLNPWGHHLTSVLLHAVNSVLVFLLLRSLTGALWRSLLVAALFGLHPLHVESVAWVAERKDVLSTCFGLLTLVFYVCYAQKQSRAEDRESSAGVGGLACGARRSTLYYSLALFFFALGLMSKPMLVTWPFVMLLLDYWPLNRIRNSQFAIQNFKMLVVEKIPFCALAAAACVVAFKVQKHGGAMEMVGNLSLGARSGNALISYCRYLEKMFWPTDMAIFYPHPGYWPLEEVLLAGVFLCGISVLFFMKQSRYPFLLMGWLWFVGTLVPVIGLVQVGGQSMADRYTYVPSLGVLLLTIWGVYELTRGWRYHQIALSVAGSTVIFLCIAVTRQQIGYWKDSETLFRHTLEVTENNYMAHNNLGTALGRKGQLEEAISQFQEAIRLNPDYIFAHYNLGNYLIKKSRPDEAISQYREAIRLKPDFADAHYNLGMALDEKGQTDAAISQFQEAIRLKPDFAMAHDNLGAAFGKKDQISEMISQYQEAIRLKPDFAEAHNDLGAAFEKKDQPDEAISQFQEAIRLKPDYPEAHNNLGIAIFKKGQVDEAISQFQEAIRLKPDYASAYNNLGTALGMKGQTDEAIHQFQEAIRLKPDYAEARYNLNYALGIKNAPAEH